MRAPTVVRRDNFDQAMTPMIDVVFNLLIFFVISASGAATERILRADLPSRGAVEADPAVAPDEAESWEVDVTLKLQLRENRFEVDMNGTVYTDVAQLKEQLTTLAEIDPSNPVILDISPEVPAGHLVDLYDSCLNAGFTQIRFAADPSRLQP